MIIIGYQGIGKSTLTKEKKGYIDLESSNFKFNGKRHDDWYIYYCQIAQDLSSQGYVVFTSSHSEIRNYFRIKRVEPAITISPDTSLKDKWIEKLRKRYISTSLSKDYLALVNADDCFEENVTDIQYCGLDGIILKDLDYSLEEEIGKYIKEHKDVDFHIRQLIN